MKHKEREKYLRSCIAFQARPLIAASIDGVEQAVVIPALAEKDSLFRTLACIAQNPSRDLWRTLVICVVNNHRPSLAGDKAVLSNHETLSLLHALVFEHRAYPGLPEATQKEFQQIFGSGLRLAYIDASSAGVEIPDRDGGVGTARKIGMDTSPRSGPISAGVLIRGL
jgi:hypothetical protein